MSQLMVEYDSMRDSIRMVQEFYRRYPTREAALDAFRNAKTSNDEQGEVMKHVDPARFRVSRYFVRMRKLARAGFLSRELVEPLQGHRAARTDSHETAFRGDGAGGG